MAEKLNYIRSLDGIRGVFCTVIIIAHWKLAFPIVPMGWEILQIFFVMSGFLITRILLKEKRKKVPFKKYANNFYLKRLFRIFPLYFGYLFFMSFLRFALKSNDFIQQQTAELEHSGIWLYTYLYNFKSWFNFHSGIPFEDSPFFSHLWSLSFEEQFYMLFPFLVFFLKERKLKILVAVLVIAPIFLKIFAYPYLLSVNNDPIWAIILIYRNFIFQLDSIALGAALAIFNFSWIKHPKFLFYFFLSVLVIAMVALFPVINNYLAEGALSKAQYPIFLTNDRLNILGYIALIGYPEMLHIGNQFMYLMPLVNIVCFFLILCSIRDTPILKSFFEHKITVYLGRISYGMYVYHFALMVIFLKAFKSITKVNPEVLPYFMHWILFFVYFSIVVLISHLSFNYFEMYFLKMKNKIK